MKAIRVLLRRLVARLSNLPTDDLRAARISVGPGESNEEAVLSLRLPRRSFDYPEARSRRLNMRKTSTSRPESFGYGGVEPKPPVVRAIPAVRSLLAKLAEWVIEEERAGAGSTATPPSVRGRRSPRTRSRPSDPVRLQKTLHRHARGRRGGCGRPGPPRGVLRSAVLLWDIVEPVREGRPHRTAVPGRYTPHADPGIRTAPKGPSCMNRPAAS